MRKFTTDEATAIGEAVIRAIEPDMFWDPEATEDCIHDPWDVVDGRFQPEEGDTFELDCARSLPSRVYVITKRPDTGEIDYRDATPEEAAEHRAAAKVEREKRRAEARRLP